MSTCLGFGCCVVLSGPWGCRGRSADGDGWIRHRDDRWRSWSSPSSTAGATDGRSLLSEPDGGGDPRQTSVEHAVAPRVDPGRSAATAGPVRQPEVGWRQGGRASPLPSRRESEGSRPSSSPPMHSLDALVADAVASGADALGVAGGDGSLAVVAAAALAHGIPFVCIPAGTRNHFALDVGVDRRDLVGALDAFTDGVERRIDVAQVNGRLFLNNVSLGIYGDAVRRPEYRDAKVRTLLATAQAVLGPGGAAPELGLVDDRGSRAPSPRGGDRLQQPVRAASAARDRHAAVAHERSAGDPRPRPTRRRHAGRP